MAGSLTLQRFKSVPDAAGGLMTRRRLLAATVPALVHSSPSRAALIDLGDRKHLFLDGSLLESARGVEFEQCIPELRRENLLRSDRPWEAARAGAFSSVLDERGTIRLWYSGCESLVDYPRMGRGARRFIGERICYAESRDGARFRKPDLGCIRIHGSTRNNVVMPGAAPGVFLDPFDIPDRRYKTLMRIDAANPALTQEWPEARGANSRAIYVAWSPDGFRWRRSAEPLLPFAVGSQKSVLWDEVKARWIVYVRGSSPQTRHYCRLEIEPDAWDTPARFVRKPGKDYAGIPLLEDEFPIAVATDALDPPGTHIYSMNAWKYPHAPGAYFAFVPVWYKDASDRVEVQLAISRDGVAWRRPWRTPLIAPGPPASGSEGQIWPAPDPIVRGGEIWLYYNAMPYTHWDFVSPKPGQGITARAVFGLDRLVCAHAPAKNAEILTHAIRFRGSRLSVNLDSGAGGRCRIALHEPGGGEIPGFGLDACTPLTGDRSAAIVRWRSGESLQFLADRPIRLRFAMDRCKLYSFQFLV